MSVISYKVSFRPAGFFYFGNERTLGPDNTDYFATSNYFPQQTTILGAMRYRLLEMKGWLKDSRGQSAGTLQEREELIGSRGFNAEKPGARQKFGVIKSLSPVFLEYEGRLLLPGALNRGYALSLAANPKQEVAWAGLNGLAKNHLPQLGGYDYKKPVDPHFIPPGGSPIVTYKKIFKIYDRVGITKQEAGEPDDKAFFKQNVLHFADSETAFVCYVQMAEATGEALRTFVTKNPNAPMGGERSIFITSIERMEIDTGIFFTYLNQSDKSSSRTQVILLSDALAPSDIYQHCDFAISKTRDFRYIITNSGTQNHYAKPAKSDAYQILEKGSVLYPSEAGLDVLRDELTSAMAFRQIGYNAFVVIEKGNASADIYSYKNEQNS